MNMVIVWLVAAVVFLAVEIITVAMTSIWCVVGSLAALLAAALGAAIWVQILLFLAVSGLCLALLYPRLKHLVGRNRQATNADKVIGATAVVTQRIDNIAGTGAVTVDGKTWTARSGDMSAIEKGSLVRVERIEGVKLIVCLIRETQAV